MKTIILFFALSFALISCSNSQDKKTNQESKIGITVLIDSKTLAKTISEQQGIQLIDVRSPEEYAQGHIGDARNININDNQFVKKIATLDSSKPIYVYCASGGRSGKAAQYMIHNGFDKVFDLEGGMRAWKSDGQSINF